MKIYPGCLILILIMFNVNCLVAADKNPSPIKNSPSTVAGTPPVPETIKVEIKDALPFRIKIYKLNGIRYVNVRDLTKIYDGYLRWYPASGKIVLSVNGKRVQFRKNRREMYISGEVKRLTHKTELVYGEIYVPLNLLLSPAWSEIVNGDTTWDESTFTLGYDVQYNLSIPRVYTTGNYTRVVMEKEGGALKFNLTEPVTNHLLIKLENVRVPTPDKLLSVNDGRINQIRVLQETNNYVSLNIEYIATAVQVQTRTLDNPSRLVIDFIPQSTGYITPTDLNSSYVPAVNKSTDVSSPAIIKDPDLFKQPESTITVVLTNFVSATGKPMESTNLNRVIKKIVIDPGHGGYDSGAVGPRGIQEKEINLKLAFELAHILREEYRYTVLLTRTDDTFVTLYDRINLANKEKADLFVSVHCNASPSRKSTGFEVYFLSEQATDVHAENVAELENAALQLEDESTRRRYEIEFILMSMASNVFLNQSSELCGLIAQSVGQSISEIENRGVKQANFYVLRGAKMPSILLETAYISNYREEKKLTDRRFQTNIVDAWVKGILNYDQRLVKKR